jgi:hypothetical protein
MSRKGRPLAALVMVAIVALTSAGCSNGSAENDNTGTAGTPIGSSGGTSTGTGVGTGTSGVSKNATTHEKAVRVAECMRANGVSAFPDPDVSGKLTIDAVLNGSSLDPNSAAWKQAINACKDLEPPGFSGSKATPEQMSARLKFAQCVRDNGVKDFPDPTKDEPIVDTNRIPSSATPSGMSTLNAAMHKCGGIIASELGRS